MAAEAGTILIVDDELLNRDLLEQELAEAGYRTLSAENGEQTIKLATGAHPELILLDAMMDGLDGFATCERLKASDATRAIPVIFLTALADTQVKLRAFRAGAVDYVTKPFQPEELTLVSQRALERKGLTQRVRLLEEAVRGRHPFEEVVCACVADLGGRRLKLAVAGGIFANVKLNQQLRELPNVGEVYVFPNMGDGGLSVGAAWLVHAAQTKSRPEPLGTLDLGPTATDEEIATAASRAGLRARRVADIHERIGRVCLDAKEVDRAVEAFRAAQRSDPTRASRLSYNLAEVMVSLKRDDGAAVVLEGLLGH